MKILLLGGNGFVGKNIISVFKNSNHRLYIFSKRDGYDLTDYTKAKELISKVSPDITINVAAKVGSLNYVTQQAAIIADENMRMLLNLFKALHEISPDSILMNPIANCAYPGNLESYTEDRFWYGKVHESVIAYGNTRRMIEVLSDCYKMQYNFKTINFLVPNMYGPFDSTDPNKAHALNALISKTVKAQKERIKNIEVWGSGIAIREWLFAEDYARIILETVSRIDDYGFSEPINIGQNFGLSVRELVDIIIRETNYPGEIIWNRNMPDGALRKVMDDKRFRKVFPIFQFLDLRTGIKRTIDYYNSIYPYNIPDANQNHHTIQ